MCFEERYFRIIISSRFVRLPKWFLRFVGEKLDHVGFASLSFVTAEIPLPCFEGHFFKKQLIVSCSEESSHLNFLSLTRAFSVSTSFGLAKRAWGSIKRRGDNGIH